MEKSHGIITRLTKLTDTSLIVHWCTQDDGMIKTVAKGARRPRSSFAGKLDLFFSADLEWSRSLRSELHILKEVAITDYREGLRKTYKDTLLASYIVELLAHVTEPDHPAPELHDLLQRALNYLALEGANKKAMLHFENELARISGVSSAKTHAHLALQQAFGKLPASRDSCIRSLDDRS